MKWIKCEDRLPNDYDRVIFCVENDEVYGGFYVGRLWKSWVMDKQYISIYEPVDRTKKAHEYVKRVVCWMPVPESPKFPAPVSKITGDYADIMDRY
jgi:hypothetical protein